MDKNQLQKRFDELDKEFYLLFEQQRVLSNIEMELRHELIKFLQQPKKLDITNEEAVIWLQKAVLLTGIVDDAQWRTDLVRSKMGPVIHEQALLADLLGLDKGKKKTDSPQERDRNPASG